MKKIILIALATLFTLSSFAQKQEAKAPEVKAAPSIENLRDPQKAMEIAKKQGKIVVYHFTGSTWCPPCMQLDAKVIHNKEFIDYAKKNIAYVNMNNDRRSFTDKEYDAKYEELAMSLGIRGFPTLVLINPKNNNIKTIVGYSGASVADYIKQIEEFKVATPKH